MLDTHGRDEPYAHAGYPDVVSPTHMLHFIDTACFSSGGYSPMQHTSNASTPRGAFILANCRRCYIQVLDDSHMLHTVDAASLGTVQKGHFQGAVLFFAATAAFFLSMALIVAGECDEEEGGVER